MKHKCPIKKATFGYWLQQEQQRRWRPYRRSSNSLEQISNVVGRSLLLLLNPSSSTTRTSTKRTSIAITSDYNPHLHRHHLCCTSFLDNFLIPKRSISGPNNPSEMFPGTQIRKKPSSDLLRFASRFNEASKIVVLTGAGVSAESGLPTFRGEGGMWAEHKSEELATPEAFAKNPGLVWQFYEWRRQTASAAQPNLAHKGLQLLEEKFLKNSPQRQLIVVTQNVDELHQRAGSKRVLELHGSLFKTRCTQCNVVKSNYKNPIVPALASMRINEPDRHVDPKDLPRCDKCSGLLRPHVVWFGEKLDPFVLKQAEGLMKVTDFLLVVGTSCKVYPAASLVPQAANRGVVVTEFNIEYTDASEFASFFFKGPCAVTLPKALGVGDEATLAWGNQ